MFIKFKKGEFMKNLLQKFSINIEDIFSATTKEKFSNFINAHTNMFYISILLFFCLILFFWGLDFYPLMDVDETRYAVMARDLIHSADWLSLKLNFVPFLEKPPLYFWLVGLSIKTWEFNSFFVRLPIALLATFLVFFTYYLGTKVISRKFGIISSLILASSIFFLILSHIAILDMVLTVFITSAIYCGFLTHFCEEKNKKFYWWMFYVFIGFGFLAKGILALVLPSIVIFIYNLTTKTTKEIFKPVNILPGLIIFSAISLPWHILMYKEYGYQFIKEYFLMHHFARFMNSVSIGRERPFLYFIPVFSLGFLPWTFTFLAFLYNGCKKLITKFKLTQGEIKTKLMSLFEVTTNEQKLILFASIYFFIIFLLFSISSTKLPTYILPVFPAAALLTGYYWWESDEKKENINFILTTTKIFPVILILAATVGLIAYYFLPQSLQLALTFKNILIFVLLLYCVSILMLLRLKTSKVLPIFFGYIIMMMIIIMIATGQIFNFVYNTGENELIEYSLKSVNSNNKSQLVTFDFAVKPSVMIVYTKKVNFITDPEFDKLDELLKYEDGPTFVIVKNKNFKNDKEYLNKIKTRLELLKTGQKYSLYVKDIKNEIKKK
jgi:4-amino-4-deoxy-L-arabinose transferase-like glycosyltransferase